MAELSPRAERCVHGCGRIVGARRCPLGPAEGAPAPPGKQPQDWRVAGGLAAGAVAWLAFWWQWARRVS